MNRLFKCMAIAGAGAGGMYYFDPVLGNRRRALLRDQVNHAVNKTSHALDTCMRDIQNRLTGTIAEMRALMASDDADDRVIRDRVRATIGRYASHPSSIEVEAENGVVWLYGPILADEVDALVRAVGSVRGVNEVINDLEEHDAAGNISALHGGGSLPGEPWELMQEHWSPTTRVAVGALGGALLLNCLARRTPGAAVLGTAGLLMGMRAWTNLESKRLLGVGGCRGIDIEKTFTINRPVDEVYRVLSEPENYTRFSDLITSVKVLDGGRIEKTIAGPAGAEVTLMERITGREPNHFIAKSSEADSPLQYALRAWFIPHDESSTKVRIQATYNPPGGAVGHAVLRVTNLDPQSLLEDFMGRAKSYLEASGQRHDASQKEAAKV